MLAFSFLFLIFLLLYAQVSHSFRMAIYRPFSPNFPPPPKHFVGRNEDVKILMELIDFSNKSYEIICIVGSPGIGKSSLAIAVGNEMIAKHAVVHYVNMAAGEFSEGQLKQSLTEKIHQNLFEGSADDSIFDKTRKWVNKIFSWNNLIVLDSCEEYINSRNQEFQQAINDILGFSSSIKILTTSRETALYKSYYEYKLEPLSRESSCKLLEQRIPFVLNDTQKNVIAELTGDIPLALQIIGSLLNVKVKPPSPTEIIEKLKDRPIPTLSPSKLDRKMQLNHSISLSYNYLGSDLQKLAQRLAHFPGSFDLSAAVNVHIYISNDSQTEADEDSVDELVARSLLEFSQETGHYHFHRLIKEFFLLYSVHLETEPLNQAFLMHFGTTLCEMTTLFVSSPKQSLTILDKERHNFQYFMNTITNPTNRSHPYYITAVECFANALKIKYLNCRFSPEELIKPVESLVHDLQMQLEHSKVVIETISILEQSYQRITDMTINLSHLSLFLEDLYFLTRDQVLRQNIINIRNDIISNINIDYMQKTPAELQKISMKEYLKTKSNYKLFVRLTIQFGYLTHILKGEDEGFNQFKMRVNIIEELANFSINHDYIAFYENFLSYKSKLNETELKAYNERILRKLDESTLTCNLSKCNYYDIASTYYNRDDYEKSIQFYEKALEMDYPTARQVSILLNLYLAYSSSGYLLKALELKAKLLHIFPLVMNETSSIIHLNIIDYYRYSRHLKFYSQSKYTMLSERIINALIDVGKKGSLDDIVTAYILAETLYDDNEFDKASKFATYALDSLSHMDQYMYKQIMHSKVVHMLIGIRLIVCKSLYHVSNSSAANDMFVQTIEYLIINNFTVSYIQDFSECCSYLISLGNFDYIKKCYWSMIIKWIKPITTVIKVLMYFIFVIPFSPEVEPVIVESTEFNLPVEVYPELIQLSNSKDLLYDEKKYLSSPYAYYQDFLSSLHAEHYYKHLVSQFVDYVIHLNSVRFLLNFVSVFLRIIILYYCVYYFVRYAKFIIVLVIVVVILIGVCVYLYSRYS